MAKKKIIFEAGPWSGIVMLLKCRFSSFCLDYTLCKTEN